MPPKPPRNRARFGGLFLLLALVAGCSGSTEPAPDPPFPVSFDRFPSWSPDGGQIVYEHDENELRILDLASGTSRFIGTGSEPKWSPDGHAIAYEGEDGIHIHVVATGADSVLFSSEPYPSGKSPAWSWDSQRLAIELQADSVSNGPHLMILDVATGAQLHRGDAFMIQPCWMPGDSAVVVVAMFPDGIWNLATSSLDGKVLDRLRVGNWADREPAVSPNGQQIAWLAMAGQPGIHVMTVGTGIQLLAAPLGQDPAWSADGSRIAYTGYNADSNTYTLWSMRPDGTDKVRLTPP